jgi:hypothetical protein
METLKINNIEIEVASFNRIANFSDISEIPFQFEKGVEFENNDGLQKAEGTLYKFDSDHSDFNCVNVSESGEMFFCDFDVEQSYNELV